ncbi:MAG: hypothetical protein AB1714_24755 [Acidobacteriota bacterium]
MTSRRPSPFHLSPLAFRLSTFPLALLPFLFSLLLCGGAQGFTGYVETKALSFFEKTTGADDWVTGWGVVFLKEEGRVGRSGFVASGRAEGITSSYQGPIVFDPADRGAARPPLSIRELYVRLRLADSVDLQLGRFELGWGKTDGYSPADAFLPRDQTDPFADEKLPLWGARLQGQRGTLRYELLATFVTTPWRLPSMEGRYSPFSEQGYFLLPADNDPPVRGFEAIRLMKTWGPWDGGVWARTGIRPAPLLTPHLDQAEYRPDGVFVPVDRRFADEHAAGIELSRVAGAYVLRGEIGASFSDDPDLGDALIWAIGCERAVGDGSMMITVCGNALDPPVDPLLLFDRAMLPAVIVAFYQNPPWGYWKVVWTTQLRETSDLLKAELDYNLTDVWKLTVGLDLPYGSTDGAFGAVSDGRRVRAGLRRSW